MGERSTRCLSGSTRQTWDEVIPDLMGMTCVWQSVCGLGSGQAPEHWPIGASHLWAWAHDRWAVVRTHRGGFSIAMLTSCEPGSTEGDIVEVERLDAIVWPMGEGRISAAARERLPRSCSVISVTGVVAMEFMELSW